MKQIYLLGMNTIRDSLSIEFPWDKNSLNNSAAVEGPAIFVTENMVTDVIKKMKQGKLGGQSGAIVNS